MSLSETEARSRLEAAAKTLLDEGINPEKITVRALADRADVALGLVNYHFGSKDRLLSDVIGRRMAALAAEDVPSHAASPRSRLVSLVERLYDFGANYPSFMRFMIRQSFDNGNYSAALTLIPVLKEILGPDVDEMQLRVMALQILMPIQATCLAPTQFHLYSGINVDCAPDRRRFVTCLMENLLPLVDANEHMGGSRK